MKVVSGQELYFSEFFYLNRAYLMNNTNLV